MGCNAHNVYSQMDSFTEEFLTFKKVEKLFCTLNR